MITNINISRILPHPQNPRKNLGDLTELSNSIKANGIFQNLTVVPESPEQYNKQIKQKKAYTGNYIAIIGHRRLAAAKLAELEEVPCAISEMSEKEQIATMLLENMQRSDLTIYEQAHGIQMMIDLGETVSGVSEKTGFSESTVRRRVKLMELDQKKLKDSIERGATLQEYAELEKINDIKLRNEVLDEIGTGSFKWKLKNAISQEKRNNNKPELIAKLKEFATKISSEKTNKLQYREYISLEDGKIKKPKDADKIKYFFIVYDTSIQLYSEKTKTSVDKNEEEKSKKLKECQSKLKIASKNAYELRIDFIKNFNAIKTHKDTIIDFAVRFMIDGYLNRETFMKVMDIKLDSDKREYTLTHDLFSEKKPDESVERSFMVAVYSCADAKDRNYYDSWNCNHRKNKLLDSVYEFIMQLGYQMSDEEIQLQNGTHELFLGK